MAGVILVTCRRKGKTNLIWRAATLRYCLDVLRGEGFAKPNPQPMFPNLPGLLRLEPHSEGLRDRIWWGLALMQRQYGRQHWG